MHLDLNKLKPVAFYPYTSIVQERIFDIEDYYNHPEIKTFQEELIEWFNEHGIKAYRDNKTAFEVEIKSVRFFYGFKDWKFSIGLSVQTDSWIKPITASIQRITLRNQTSDNLGTIMTAKYKAANIPIDDFIKQLEESGNIFDITYSTIYNLKDTYASFCMLHEGYIAQYYYWKAEIVGSVSSNKELVPPSHKDSGTDFLKQ